MTLNSAIELVHHSSINADYLDELIPYLKPLSQDIKITLDDPGLYDAVEWAYPAALAISLLGHPLLNGFLQELGAGGARTLKSALKNVFTRTKKQNTVWATDSERKNMLAWQNKYPDEPVSISDFGRQGPVLSLEFRLGLMAHVRFIFLHQLGEPEFEQALLAVADKLPEALSVLQERSAITAEDVIDSINRQRLLNYDSRLNYVYLVGPSRWVDAAKEG